MSGLGSTSSGSNTPTHHQQAVGGQNMSPFISHRTLVGVGSTSMPSSRASAIHEDHHHERSNSIADLAQSMRELSAHQRFRSRSGSMDSDDGSSNLMIQSDSKLGTNADEFDLDSTRGEPTSRWSEDKHLHTSADIDDTSEEEAHSPVERSAAPSPLLSARNEEKQVKQTEGRLLIVANRLPVSMKVTKKKSSDGGKEVNDISFTSSSGGLVSALGGCEMKSRWLGWPGAEVKRAADRQTVREKLDGMNCIPVFLTEAVCDPFYNGFCNNLLWPLFHYLPLPVESITTADAQFDAYQIANQAFADVVLKSYQEGDIVWIHDYHLLLVPSILRKHHPNIKIGFFFHTPFPAFEIYRVMPARQELLHGVLSSDLIGFHTPDYQRHFQDSCVRILGASSQGNQLTYRGFTARCGAYPIGIDPKRFITSIESEQTKQIMEQYKKEFHGKKVLLGIDRLDYIKGIQHKIYALERLFEKHPKLAQEIVLVQIAVPSRTDVVEYKKLTASTHKLVGRVNGKFGGVGSAPIHYLDQSIPFDRMCALYRVADAMVITSVRDGMNLVAYEYIVCQKDMAGTLILSEFAGAAGSLDGGPLEVNPWSISSVCDAMYRSLTMPEAERRERNAAMFRHVTTHTSSAWARQFLTATLEATKTPLTWLKDLARVGSEEDSITHEAASVLPITPPNAGEKREASGSFSKEKDESSHQGQKEVQSSRLTTKAI